jgi:peptidoglycan L-alanyl-D-glutamate endopeptidase CwlK
MSSPLTKEATLYRQRLLSACGFYKKILDGEWGSDTDDAEQKFQQAADALKSIGTFDKRSEQNIASLHIKAQELARQFMLKATTGSMIVRIISGNRTYEEQNKLFAQGRFGNPPPIVTKARGGQSNHNFAIAWDIGVFTKEGKYLPGNNKAEEKEYDKIFDLVKDLPIEWGGNWKSIVDRPHYQVPTGKPVSEVRALFEAGSPYC